MEISPKLNLKILQKIKSEGVNSALYIVEDKQLNCEMILKQIDKKKFKEYDKYFGQPIKLLDAAGVIKGKREGRGYVYSVINYAILEYISFRERNSLNFLCMYIEKVLRDSGIYKMFEFF